MTNYDLYGSLLRDINTAKKFLETKLEIKFDAHESFYQGGEYFRYGKTGGENFLLKQNIDLNDNKPAEMLFPEYPILFYVNNTFRAADLQCLVEQNAGDFVLLRHENFNE
jgi:hypothetical protein